MTCIKYNAISPHAVRTVGGITTFWHFNSFAVKFEDDIFSHSIFHNTKCILLCIRKIVLGSLARDGMSGKKCKQLYTKTTISHCIFSLCEARTKQETDSWWELQTQRNQENVGRTRPNLNSFDWMSSLGTYNTQDKKFFFLKENKLLTKGNVLSKM